jgi:replicative DNA helicase
MSDPVMQPHDLRAEEEVLGAMLTMDDTLTAVQAEIGLRPEYFYRRDHQVIFAAMLALANEGIPINEVTVGNQLAKEGEQLHAAGGRDRLGRLSLPKSPGHALHFAAIVAAKALWRRRFDAAQLIKEAAVEEDTEKLATGHAALADDPTHDKALYDADRQKDLLFELMEGKAKAEFYWPLDKLNRLQSGGMRRGQLIVLSGYTNEGKSHFAGQLLDQNAKHGRVCLYDNEMDPAEQAARRVTRATGVPYGTLLDGALDDTDRSRVMAHLNGPAFWPIVDTAGWTVEDVSLHIRQHRWDFVVIDILHNFPFENEREIAAAVARLKAAAKLARCCIVLVAHVNRGGITGGMRRRPVRSDLRWSGEIENLADAVCFVYRDQDPETFEPTEFGFIYLDKCRGGKLGGEAVRFDPERLRFSKNEHEEDYGQVSGMGTTSWP